MSFEKFKEYHNANYHDGDSTFDERTYRKSNGDDFDNCFVQDCYDHFEAGAASRQAEIDDSENTRAVLYRENMDLRESNIELQKRINDVLKSISKKYDDDGWLDSIELKEVIANLKGESSEK